MKLCLKEALNLSKPHEKILRCLEDKKQNLKSMKKKLRLNLKENLTDLIKNHFIKYSSSDQLYEITISGLDALALNYLQLKGLSDVEGEIGVGKEAEIFKAKFNGRSVVLKFHRAGKNTFKGLKRAREGIEQSKSLKMNLRRNKLNWVDCSKGNARKEFNLLKKFYGQFNIPEPVTYNRHILLMEYIDGPTLYEMEGSLEREEIDRIYNTLIDFIVEFYNLGYVHNDFNEFNIMINPKNEVIIIDFPQAIEIENVEDLEIPMERFKKDFKNIKEFFKRRFLYENMRNPLEEINNL